MTRTPFDSILGWSLRSVLLPSGDRLMGHPMMRRLRFLQQAQWWSPSELESYRDKQLQYLISCALEVPLYRDLLNGIGISSPSGLTLADMRRIPPVTKAMLRKNYPGRTTRQTRQKMYEAATSGSTGQNFRVLEDAFTAGWYRASFMLALSWAGYQLGEKHLQTGMTLKRSFDRRMKDLLLRCYYFSAYDLSDEALDRALDILDNKRIGHLWGYPGSLYCLAMRARSQGFNRPLKSLVTWGDYLYPNHRACIQDAFKTRVYDTYGCGEGIQVAAQCGHGQTYHLHHLDVIVDVVDDNGQPVPAGQSGNLLLTRLHPGPMPLIRYQVGDIGAIDDSSKCACGRNWPVLKALQGRSADAITTPSGNRLIVHFFTGILEHFPEVGEFQVVQERPDSITVNVVPTPLWSRGSESAIIQALQEKGAALDINVSCVKSISLTPGGKRRFVVSTLKPEPVSTK